VSKDIDNVLSVEEIDPIEYMKSSSVRYTIALLRRGSKSAFYREDGVIKLVVSGNTINGMRLNNVLTRDGYTKVLLVPSSIMKRNDGTVVVGCWFMVRKSGEVDEEDIEKIVEEVEKEITQSAEEQKEQGQTIQQQEQAGEEKVVLKLR